MRKQRGHRSVDKDGNFTSSHIFWANKLAADPEKLLFPLIPCCAGSQKGPLRGKIPHLTCLTKNWQRKQQQQNATALGHSRPQLQSGSGNTWITRTYCEWSWARDLTGRQEEGGFSLLLLANSFPLVLPLMPERHLALIHVTVWLTEMMEIRAGVPAQAKSKHVTVIFFFFCSGMIHNAASPKAGKLAHAPSTLSAKTQAAAPRCSGCSRLLSLPRPPFLFFRTKTAWDGQRQLLCVCTFGFVHVCSCGTWGPESRLPSKLRVFLPQFKDAALPALSLAWKPLSYCASSLCYLQPPSLRFGFKKGKKSETGKNRLLTDLTELPGSCRRINIKRASNIMPCPSSKRLSYSWTPVLMMYNVDDD